MVQLGTQSGDQVHRERRRCELALPARDADILGLLGMKKRTGNPQIRLMVEILHGLVYQNLGVMVVEYIVGHTGFMSSAAVDVRDACKEP